MTNENRETQVSTNLQQMKAQSRTRLTRIRSILQEAAAQTFTEVKEGSGELRNMTAETLKNAMAQRQEADTLPTTGSTSPQVQSAIADFLAAIRQRFQLQVAVADEKLTQRYGDRYRMAQQRVRDTAQHYREAIATAQAEGTDVVQPKQLQLEQQASSVGVWFAQTEQKVKQRLRSLLQTAKNAKTN
ncbi:MAG TPA: hypothetical protein V6D19_10770 [Stenomitos sp.]